MCVTHPSTEYLVSICSLIDTGGLSGREKRKISNMLCVHTPINRTPTVTHIAMMSVGTHQHQGNSLNYMTDMATRAVGSLCTFCGQPATQFKGEAGHTLGHGIHILWHLSKASSTNVGSCVASVIINKCKNH